MKRKRIKVELIGHNSNAFNLLALCKRAAMAEWTKDEWLEFQNKAVDGNYDHLLATIQEYFDVN